MYHKKPSKPDFVKQAKENAAYNKKQKPFKLDIGNKKIKLYPVPLSTNPNQLEKDWKRDQKLIAEIRKDRHRFGRGKRGKSKPCKNAA